MANIEFIIPTFKRVNHLMCVINSIVAQTSPNWKIHIVSDNSPQGILDEVINFWKNEERIKFTILNERHNDWGHTPRNFGLNESTEDWVVMSGEDNYYVPIFVEEFLKEANDSINFIFCNMVTNYNKNQYIPVNCKIECGFIDIGCYMVRPKLAKQIGLENKYKEIADWVLADKYTKQFSGIKQISKILYVHN